MDDLEYILESVFGEVLDIEDLAPGVCLFAISRNERGFAREYYLVDQTSTIIDVYKRQRLYHRVRSREQFRQ